MLMPFRLPETHPCQSCRFRRWRYSQHMASPFMNSGPGSWLDPEFQFRTDEHTLPEWVSITTNRTHCVQTADQLRRRSVMSWEPAVNRTYHQMRQVFLALLKTDDSGHNQLDIHKKSYSSRGGLFTLNVLERIAPQLHFFAHDKSQAPVESSRWSIRSI